MKRKVIQLAFQKTIPVMVGYLVLGFGYGIYSASKSYGLGWVFPISLFVYAGTMQYVLVDLLVCHASVLEGLLTTFMVNARHLFYGISMLEPYQVLKKEKPYVIFALTDETYSLVVQEVPEGISKRWYYFFISLFDHCYWVLGSCLGALVGSANIIPSKGIEFSMTALFLTVFLDQWKEKQDHFSALFGLVASIGSILLFGKDHFLIPTMILIALALYIRGKRERI